MGVLTTVIPVYNGGHYLPVTLQSIARQTRLPDRVVVLDDASTDDTPEVARAFKDCPCDHVRNPQNLGLFPNHNRALEFAAETDYLHILHANDLIKPTFFERLTAALDSVPGEAFAYSQYEIIDERDQYIGALSRPSAGSGNVVSTAGFLAAQAQLKAILIDAAVLKTNRKPLPCRFQLDLAQVADCVFHSELATHFRHIVAVPERLLQYRMHQGATKVNTTRLQSWVLDEWKAMQLIAGWIPENDVSRWVRRLKLRVLFAARSRVKVQMTRAQSPEFSSRIAHATRETVGALPWFMGGLAVFIRDLVSYRLLKRAANPLLK